MGFLIRLLLKYAVIAVSIWLAVLLIPGLSFTGDIVAFLMISAVFWLINTFAKPVIKLLSLPLIAMTFGLFILVINFVLFWFVIWLSGYWELGLTSEGIVATFLGAVVVSVVSTVLNWFVD
jgi:putative membrane protein